MASFHEWRAGAALVAVLALGACQMADGIGLTGPGGGSTDTRKVERDVEAPEIFGETDDGLWDGRPSLGGVWVAYPEVTDPERVIIRNTENDRFVIGALFRRERLTPGPAFQVSSDAAAELGLLAGQPARLNVTALRKETVEEEATPPPPEELDALPAPAPVDTAELDDLAAVPAAAPAAASPAPAPAPSALAKPYIQIGIFSVKANATATAAKLRGRGVVPTVLDQTSRGKSFQRVIVGPFADTADRASVLKTVKNLGFNDAYFVTN